MSLTEKQVQSVLYDRMLRKYELACPNYTPAGWWECDVFATTAAGYSTEFEIKLTKADFKRDAEKSASQYACRSRGREIVTKYCRLALSDPRGPNRFFYVTPEGLLTPDQIPEWAGHIEVVNYRGWLSLAVRKKAPTLHKNRVEDSVKAHCRSVFYYRFWNMRLKHYPSTIRESGSSKPSQTNPDCP